MCLFAPTLKTHFDIYIFSQQVRLIDTINWPIFVDGWKKTFIVDNVNLKPVLLQQSLSFENKNSTIHKITKLLNWCATWCFGVLFHSTQKNVVYNYSSVITWTTVNNYNLLFMSSLIKQNMLFSQIMEVAPYIYIYIYIYI